MQDIKHSRKKVSITLGKLMRFQSPFLHGKSVYLVTSYSKYGCTFITQPRINYMIQLQNEIKFRLLQLDSLFPITHPYVISVPHT